MRKEMRVAVTVVFLWSHSAGLATKGEEAESGELVPLISNMGRGPYHSNQYWIGTGQGDLSKGTVVCQRVAELAARADLAKQVRVLLKEHLIDRTRERTGREVEQDIELTREEIVQEYLHDVKIVDHRIDEVHKTCAVTAVMPRNQGQLKQDSATPEVIPPGTR